MAELAYNLDLVGHKVQSWGLGSPKPGLDTKWLKLYMNLILPCSKTCTSKRAFCCIHSGSRDHIILKKNLQYFQY